MQVPSRETSLSLLPFFLSLVHTFPTLRPTHFPFMLSSAIQDVGFLLSTARDDLGVGPPSGDLSLSRHLGLDDRTATPCLSFHVVVLSLRFFNDSLIFPAGRYFLSNLVQCFPAVVSFSILECFFPVDFSIKHLKLSPEIELYIKYINLGLDCVYRWLILPDVNLLCYNTEFTFL